MREYETRQDLTWSIRELPAAPGWELRLVVNTGTAVGPIIMRFKVSADEADKLGIDPADLPAFVKGYTDYIDNTQKHVTDTSVSAEILVEEASNRIRHMADKLRRLI